MIYNMFKEIRINDEVYFHIDYYQHVVQHYSRWEIESFFIENRDMSINDRMIINCCKHNTYNLFYINGYKDDTYEMYQVNKNAIEKVSCLENNKFFKSGLYVDLKNKKLIAKLKMMMV